MKDEKKTEDVAPFPSLSDPSLERNRTGTPMTVKELGLAPRTKIEQDEDEHRSNLGMFLRGEFIREQKYDDVPYDYTEDSAMDDISMSPIPFDHEDPTTLMELPENILKIPISPCGPHDDIEVDDGQGSRV
jgi:hypothetical protein